MGPDLFGLLYCLPHTSSFCNMGPHVIPLTAGVKIRSPSLSLAALYEENYACTDPWAIFTRKGAAVQGSEEHRKEAEALLQRTFVTSNKRALRILFTYRPLPGCQVQGPLNAQKDGVEQTHVIFDFHHPAFIAVLKRSSEEVVQHLKYVTKL